MKTTSFAHSEKRHREVPIVDPGVPSSQRQKTANLYQALLCPTNSKPKRKAPNRIRRMRQLQLTQMLTSRQSDEGTGKHQENTVITDCHFGKRSRTARRQLTRTGDDGHAKAEAKTGGSRFRENSVIHVFFLRSLAHNIEARASYLHGKAQRDLWSNWTVLSFPLSI